MAVAKTHVSLNVRDVEKSVAFYEAFFGVSAHKRRPGYANFDLESPALKLALNQTQSSPISPITESSQIGLLNHLGIVLDSSEAVEATRNRLASVGLISIDEGDTVCCHARQDKVWAHDPDGNAWEVYVILDDMLDGVFEAPPDLNSEVVCCVPKPRGLAMTMVSTCCEK
jgi:catechol 2,3-dioxygenase-like lactoylglutathione lyase family enzyme